VKLQVRVDAQEDGRYNAGMRQPPQFTLGRLMAFVGLLALPLSVAHYYPRFPPWLQHITAAVAGVVLVNVAILVVVWGYFGVLALVCYCSSRSNWWHWLLLTGIVALLGALLCFHAYRFGRFTLISP
jgi:hypothetical protein